MTDVELDARVTALEENDGGSSTNGSYQWRIQDFPEVVCQSLKAGANLLFDHFFPKTAQK